MKILLLTYLTIFLSVAAGLAQDFDTTTDEVLYREIQLTNIQFSIGDTVIPYSLLVEPTGEIDFEEGYDFSYYKIDIARYHFEGKRKNTKTYKDTIISKDSEPITLTSYFPPLNQDSTKFINGYDFEFGWSPHYEYEIRLSYILNGVSAKKLYQSDLDSIVRIVVPEDGIDHEIHNIFQIDFRQNPTEIHYIKTQHDYNGDFEILEQGISSISKKKDERTLFTEFEKLNLTQDSHFIKVDGSIQYLIEFKTTESFFAGMRHYRDKDGRIPENAFPWTVMQLYEKNKKRK